MAKGKEQRAEGKAHVSTGSTTSRAQRKKVVSRRALTVNDLLNYRPHCMNFEGQWLASFGRPERTGTWLIWGNSGNGKTRFAIQLTKYLASLGERVAYNSVEEGASESLRMAFEAENVIESARRMLILDKEPMPELIARLRRPKSPDIIIIDSLQYTGLKYADYKILRDTFRRKLFVFISHAEGKLPAGRVAQSIRFDAFVKIWIEGYQAFPVSRYGGGESYTIWDNPPAP
jgi:hypothetical protein